MLSRSTLLKKTLRVPIVKVSIGSSEEIVRQLDIALMTEGFKLSRQLLEYMSALSTEDALDEVKMILSSVRELIGDNVEHNVYFIDFPEGIPDTLEFWNMCIVDALSSADENLVANILFQVMEGTINLLDLPKYGKYLHTYTEMLAHHETLLPAASDRITLLHLGKSLDDEIYVLYLDLVKSTVPLSDADKLLLAELAEICIDKGQPKKIPIRENLSIINMVRVRNGRSIIADNVTDVLRLACALSNGDETLATPTKFKSFSRKERKALLETLDSIILDAPAKLQDVCGYREEWKRLGERLHPHEYKLPLAKQVFDVARRDVPLKSPMSYVADAFQRKDIDSVIEILKTRPGYFCRNLDYILRTSPLSSLNKITDTILEIQDRVSARVVLSLLEHFVNRWSNPQTKRLFVNRKGSTWVMDETREPLDTNTTNDICLALSAILDKRLPVIDRLVVNDDIANVALPISQKNMASGFSIMPRGSESVVVLRAFNILRFFVYWKEKNERTDYDLSTLFLDSSFNVASQVSWTGLRRTRSDGERIAVHSGDIVESHNGASEFIDIRLDLIDNEFIVPQLNIYRGDDFDTVQECFFGYMFMHSDQKSKPFEPRTVRMKSDIRGKGKIALPIAFAKIGPNDITVKWLQLQLKGLSWGNRTEKNSVTTSLIMSSIMNREYLKVEYITEKLKDKAKNVIILDEHSELSEPITYIGRDIPQNIPIGSDIISLHNLQRLIPN